MMRYIIYVQLVTMAGAAIRQLCQGPFAALTLTSAQNTAAFQSPHSVPLNYFILFN